MRRRNFLAATGLAGAAALGGTATAASALAPEAKGSTRELIELRVYRCEKPEMAASLDKFFAEAAVPAWNRLGSKPVGIFALADGQTLPAGTSACDRYVVLGHKSAESFLCGQGRLWADAAYQKAGAACLDTPKDAPPFTRIETSLLVAFEKAPTLLTPGGMKPERVFQLRIYESACEERARLKIDMFNGGGELDLFRDAGLTWVFFGQSVAGPKMPNLTYMVGFESPDAQKAAWDKFKGSEGWKKLSADPKYKDTVSAITNLILKPTAASQI